MGKIVAVHSFRGGTGKSNITANLAFCLASRGNKVAVIDMDIQSPGIHILFGLQGSSIERALDDYLLEGYPIEKLAQDVGNGASLHGGQLLLIPSSMQLGQISKILKEGYSVALLDSGIKHLLKVLNLDYLLVDTHPGVNEETLFSFTISDVVFVVMRPDSQDYEGTDLTLEASRRLHVPASLIVNNIPPSLDPDEVRTEVEAVYNTPVAAAIPHCPELMDIASSELIFSVNSDHLFSRKIAQIGDRVMRGG